MARLLSAAQLLLQIFTDSIRVLMTSVNFEQVNVGVGQEWVRHGVGQPLCIEDMTRQVFKGGERRGRTRCDGVG